MLSLLLPLLSPLLRLLDNLFGYVADTEKTKLTTQAQVDTATIQGESAVEQRWWFVALPVGVLGMVYALYYGKVVLVDNVIMNGTWSTPALHGSADIVGWIVVSGLFLHSGLNRLIK